MTKRKVICADAFDWFAAQDDHSLDSIFTSLPDPQSEDIVLYSDWFRQAMRFCFKLVRPEGFVILYQTDRKIANTILSKIWLAYDEASKLELNPIWHKIVLRHEVGATDFFRPTFGHLVCFSQEGKSGRAFPDVYPYEKFSWEDGMPLKPTLAACEFLARSVRYVVDPFCGVGTVLAAANAVGLNALGIDLDPDLCKKAETLTVVDGKLSHYYSIRNERRRER